MSVLKIVEIHLVVFEIHYLKSQILVLEENKWRQQSSHAQVCIIGGPLVSVIALSAVHPIVVEMFPPGIGWRIDWQTNISSTSLKQANKFPFFSPAQKETITDGCGGLIRVFRVKLESFTLMNCFVFYTWQVSWSHTYTLHTHNYFHLQVSSGVDNLEVLTMALNLTHQMEYFTDLWYSGSLGKG